VFWIDSSRAISALFFYSYYLTFCSSYFIFIESSSFFKAALNSSIFFLFYSLDSDFYSSNYCLSDSSLCIWTKRLL